MTQAQHSYGLDWIDEDKLYEITERCFSSVLANRQRPPAPPDPFALVVQAVATGQTVGEMLEFERIRAMNKTISNAVGLWHQNVLGLADDWGDLGVAGGSVDLKICDKTTQREICVEVKNRYNTIKASDEKNTWDKLDMLSRVNSAPSYLVQIVPKTAERYDRPWKVSGRQPRETVRCCDGATAYTMAFGREDALLELYRVFPRILCDVAGAGDAFDSQGADALFFASMPM